MSARRSVILAVQVSRPVAAAAAQYVVARVIQFRNDEAGRPRHELTVADSAHFTENECLAGGQCAVQSDDSHFVGVVDWGFFGVHQFLQCAGYVAGWSAIGDTISAGYLASSALSDLFVRVLRHGGELIQFALPVLCNRPAQAVELRDVNDHTVATCPLEGPVTAGATSTQQCVPSDGPSPPRVVGVSIAEGASGVDPLATIDVTLDGVANPTGKALADVHIEDPEQRTVVGTATMTGPKTLHFEPLYRLRYDTDYTLVLDSVVQGSFRRHFHTFKPRVIRHLEGIVARDVAMISGAQLGLTACSQYLVVADASQGDQNGLRVYDVSDLSAGNLEVGFAPTGAEPWALRVAPRRAANTPLTLAGGEQHLGPFVMSTDGGLEHFGSWRLFTLEGAGAQSVVPREIAHRVVNHSFTSFADLQAGHINRLNLVPAGTGFPADLSSFDSQFSYVANPDLGLVMIAMEGMEPAPWVGNQANAEYDGAYHAVSTLKGAVVGLREDKGITPVLELFDPALAVAKPAQATLPAGSKALAVTALGDWPARLDAPGATQPGPVEPRDLVVAACGGKGLCAVPAVVGTTQPSFAPGLLPAGMGRITTPGRAPRGMAADRQTGLLFAADSTAGLTIIDLRPAGGADIDRSPQDGIDDRVLGTVDLGGSLAQQVAYFHDIFGTPVAAVSAGEAGVFFVQVGPEPAAGAAGSLQLRAAVSGPVIEPAPATVCRDGELTLRLSGAPAASATEWVVLGDRSLLEITSRSGAQATVKGLSGGRATVAVRFDDGTQCRQVSTSVAVVDLVPVEVSFGNGNHAADLPMIADTPSFASVAGRGIGKQSWVDADGDGIGEIKDPITYTKSARPALSGRFEMVPSDADLLAASGRGVERGHGKAVGFCHDGRRGRRQCGRIGSEAVFRAWQQHQLRGQRLCR